MQGILRVVTVTFGGMYATAFLMSVYHQMQVYATVHGGGEPIMMAAKMALQVVLQPVGL